jgi:hypothetical protein
LDGAVGSELGGAAFVDGEEDPGAPQADRNGAATAPAAREPSRLRRERDSLRTDIGVSFA